MSSPLTQRQLERELIDLLEARTGLRPRVAMLLGSGHASITNQLKDKVAIVGMGCTAFISVARFVMARLIAEQRGPTN